MTSMDGATLVVGGLAFVAFLLDRLMARAVPKRRWTKVKCPSCGEETLIRRL